MKLITIKTFFIVRVHRHRPNSLTTLLSSFLNQFKETVFVGDDVPDLPLLRHAGFSFAVANAVAEVKNHCDVTTVAAGGFGAVREVCDLILGAREDS